MKVQVNLIKAIDYKPENTKPKCQKEYWIFTPIPSISQM